MNINGISRWKWTAGTLVVALVAVELLGGALGLGYLFAFLSLAVIAVLMGMTLRDGLRNLWYRRTASHRVEPTEPAKADEAPHRRTAA